MLGNLFYWLLNMSILGTVAGFLVLLLRRIKRLPRFVPYLLWAVPLLRLWLPIGLSSRYSLLNMLSGFAVKTVGLYGGLSAMNFIQAADTYFPLVFRREILADVFSVAGIIWAIIAAAALLTAAALYLLTKHELKTAEPEDYRTYRSDKILSPAVFGILRPRIVLPKGMTDTSRAYVLLHEQMHIRRLDNLWRLAAVATACVHWFNPFVWLFLKAFFEDMELSCDERVLRRCGEAEKKAYAAALLDCEAGKTVFSSAFGGAKTRVRIAGILSYKRLTVASAAGFILLTAAAAAAMLTNAAV